MSDQLRSLSATPREAARHGLELNQDGIRRSAYQLLSYPHVGWTDLARLWPELAGVSPPVRERLETDATYAVYLDRQQADIAAYRRDESMVLEESLDFGSLPGPVERDQGASSTWCARRLSARRRGSRASRPRR